MSRELPIVFVQMDEDNGVSISDTIPALIPFAPCPSIKSIDCRGVKYVRYQLPLIQAHCQTIHSAQGLTAPGDLCIDPSPNTPFEMALEYVAISRVTSLANLHTLRPFRPIHFNHKNNQRTWIHKEMDRLRQTFGHKQADVVPPRSHQGSSLSYDFQSAAITTHVPTIPNLPYTKITTTLHENKCELPKATISVQTTHILQQN
jgi:hypothetical protein